MLLILIMSIVGNAFVFFLFDRDIQPGLTIGDAFWYSVISITTIGYGDFSAVSLGARIGTIFFIVLIGLTVFSSAIGIGVDWVLEQQYKERSGMGSHSVKEHLLIINFQSKSIYSSSTFPTRRECVRLWRNIFGTRFTRMWRLFC